MSRAAGAWVHPNARLRDEARRVVRGSVPDRGLGHRQGNRGVEEERLGRAVRLNRVRLEQNAEDLVDFDLDATAQARSSTASKVYAACGTCAKPIYRETPYPGVPSEWRHVSSGAPTGYSPREHLASLTEVGRHGHRWTEAFDGLRTCEVEGCGAQLVNRPREVVQKHNAVSDRAAAVQESRRRGSEASKRSTTKAPKTEIPF